jgi:hypothetical protein
MRLLVGLLAVLLRRRLGILVLTGEAQELLLSTPLRETLEVAANRGAHLLEVALLAHGRTFPPVRAIPARS